MKLTYLEEFEPPKEEDTVYLTKKHSVYYEYLTTLRKPNNLTKDKFRQVKKKALKFAVINSNLCKKATKGILYRLVVDRRAKRKEILEVLYDGTGYRGKEGTY